MGKMSELDAEKEQDVNDLRSDWREKLSAYFAYENTHSPAHRRPEEMRELHRLEGIVQIARMKYETAREQRRKV